MNAQQKISRLQPLLEHGEKQYTSFRYEAGFIVWQERLVETFKLLFGSDSEQVLRVSKLTFGPPQNADFVLASSFRRAAAFKHDLDLVVGLLKRYIDEFSIEALEDDQKGGSPLSRLHPTIQQAASTLYATGHYRQALLDAYIAVDRAVQQKSQLIGSGTRLMETAFSPGNPVLKIGESADEQQGFLSLFRGAMLAIRNPKAHSLGGTHDAQRALEWLSFASVLLRNLDEAVLAQPSTVPQTP